MRRAPAVVVGILLLLAHRHGTRADEGMWLLNQPPRDLLKSKYHFDLTDEWLERAMKASVRFNNGGSGSFVSPDGLAITNHHIGADSLQKLSTRDRDLSRDGFYARTHAEELKCPDLELNVLQSIDDVTKEVQAAVKPEMTPAQAAKARGAVIARIRQESLTKTGLRSDVVSLYQGGLYHLYRYKKYTDVRLVMAPEQSIAFFGGDVDNFEFPRYNLDVCFFRVWEDGKPAKTPHYFPWSKSGPTNGDIVFVSGHPGSTNRLETMARLKHRRDVTVPYLLGRARYLESLLEQFSQRGPEEARMASGDLQRIANTRKALAGQYHGLLDPKILETVAQREEKLRADVAADPELAKTHGSAWDRIAAAEQQLAAFEHVHSLLETGDAFNSRYFTSARTLLRLAEETAKPDGERLPDYVEASLASLRFRLFSPAPIHPELEQAKLAGSLMFMAETLGGEHPLVLKALAGKSPQVRAAELTAGTRLGDPQERRRLADAGLKAIKESKDTMIQFAIIFEAEARAIRKRHEEQVTEPERQAYAQIAEARFKKLGASVPPDATFTLRLAFGVVQGYAEEGVDRPYFTTLDGTFERAERQGNREPFMLPKRWLDGKDKLDLKTPFNFVSTADTIGGNSGSPVLNRKGEFVGINFDRNRHGLVRNYVYTDGQARHIAVHSQAVLEALRKLYDAEPLVKELQAKP